MSPTDTTRGLASRLLRPLPLGGVALALVGGGVLYRAARRRGVGDVGPLEAQRVLTVLRPPGEVFGVWQDPDSLRQALAPFADVTSTGPGQTRWVLRLPGGRMLSYAAELAEERPGERSRWHTRPGVEPAAEVELRLRPAPADRGTEATLFLRLGAPGGALTRALGGPALGLAAQSALRRFKSLAETGEIPTLERNPAARPEASERSRRPN